MLEELMRHAGRYYGKYSGEVTDNTDDEHQGRVMVKVPAVLGLDVKVRARPCVPYGHFFVPPKGTKVWVEFEAGDVHYPLWVGTWLPVGATPAEAQLSPPDNRVLQTASGHTIEIQDKDGEEKIVIRHKGNAFISIDKNGSVLVANQKGSFLHLDADGQKAVLMQQHGNLVTMDKDGVSVVHSAGNAMVQLSDATVRVAATKVVVQGQTVQLGEQAMEPTLLGQTFMAAIWPLVMTHQHPTALGPSGPPLPPLSTTPIGPTHLTSAVLVK